MAVSLRSTRSAVDKGSSPTGRQTDHTTALAGLVHEGETPLLRAIPSPPAALFDCDRHGRESRRVNREPVICGTRRALSKMDAPSVDRMTFQPVAIARARLRCA